MAESRADVEYYQKLLRPLVAGRKLIVAGGPVAALKALGLQLRALGAERPFLLGSHVGPGELPAPEEAEWCSLDISAGDIIAGMRAYERAIAAPAPELRRALDHYDPDGNAWVVASFFLGDVRAIAGRRRYGAPPSAWLALEDKVSIDRFWDAIELARAASEVVPVEAAALAAASDRLDRGAGTVWAGDARDGLHGGAICVRRVRGPDDAAAARAALAERCDRVRVMPFLEGIPCSIHGIVLPDGIAVLRPVEMITLRRSQGPEFAYAGCATFWDPKPPDREAMRAIARRVGAALRERCDYRGPFTVDGVMTEEGFLPTELNARFGAGLSVMARGLPELPIVSLCLAAVEGEPLDFRAADLEALIVEASDRLRGGGGWRSVQSVREETRIDPLALRDGCYALAREGEAVCGRLITGPGDVGGFARFDPHPERTPQGPSLAPRVVDVLALADREYSLGIGSLEPAREVR